MPAPPDTREERNVQLVETVWSSLRRATGGARRRKRALLYLLQRLEGLKEHECTFPM
jgi:hypothetical protein